VVSTPTDLFEDEVARLRKSVVNSPRDFIVSAAVYMVCLLAPLAPLRLAFTFVAIGAGILPPFMLAWRWRSLLLRFAIMTVALWIGMSELRRHDALPFATVVQAICLMSLTLTGLLWLFRRPIIHFCRLHPQNAKCTV
jgi:hypothetical protein